MSLIHPRLPALIMLLLGLGANAAAVAETLRLGVEGAYPPFNYVDKQGQPAGFDVDIGNALCAKMKVQCVWFVQDWDGIIPGLLARKYDAIVSSVSITPQREQAVAFSIPYYSYLVQMVAPKGSQLLPTADSLRGKRVGAQRGVVAAQWAQARLASSSQIKLYDTQDNANLDLAAGRLDAVLADRAALYAWLQTEDGQRFAFRGEPIRFSERDGGKVAVALRKGSDALRARFDAAIQAIRDDGTYKAINAKYFPFSIE